MRRFLIALLPVMSMLALCLIGPQQVQAAPQTHEQASYYYYPFQDSNGAEWIAIPSYQLSQDQNYWIVFPAALAVYSDGSYNIPGSWWWGTDGEGNYYLYYNPDAPLMNYQVTQQVTTSVIETVTTSVNLETVSGNQNDNVQAEFDTASLSSVSSSSYIQSS